MKKILLVLMMLVICVSVCEAHEKKTNIEFLDEFSAGAQVDLPNLIKITANSSIGIEVGVSDLQKTWTDSAYGMVKFTWVGSLLDFSK